MKSSWIIFTFLFSMTSFAQVDPHQKNQWYLHNTGNPITLYPFPNHPITVPGKLGVDIGWFEAQDAITSQAVNPVVIAVIDSGIDPLHPELQGRIAAEGFDFLEKASPLVDLLGHGTHVSGIIAALNKNGVGISGIASLPVKILPLRVLSDKYRNFLYKGRLISDYVADAVRYAVAHGASIINLSMGWPKTADTENVRSAFADAVKAGVLIVAAAGNDHKDVTTFPCAYDGVLCVGAISNTGDPTFFTNFGGTIDILAPGDVILSLFPTLLESAKYRLQGYDILSGTSQAAPQISGIAGILKSINPAMSLDELKARLFLGAHFYSSKALSLYGTPKILEAISAAPKAVYQPNFKGSGELVLNEASLNVNGRLSIRNLWSVGNNVQVSISGNGQELVKQNFALLASSSEVQIPWTYVFPSLNESLSLNLSVTITDDSGTNETFTNRYRVTRDLKQIQSATSIQLTKKDPNNPVNWLDTSSPIPMSSLRPIATVGSSQSSAFYYHSLPPVQAGVPVQLFNPKNDPALTVFTVPNIQQLNQVLRMDIKNDGSLCWIFTGNFKTKDGFTFQFLFLDSNFKPLYGDQSIWQMSLSGVLGPAVVRDYSKPGSWVKSGDRLVPAILTSGVFPDPDNFSKLDQRHYSTGTHLYYLQPRVTAQGVVLDPRVVDNAKFWDRHFKIKLVNLLPLNSKEELQGHLKILAIEGDGIDSNVKILDIRDVASLHIDESDTWNSLSASGSLIRVNGSTSSVLFNIFDGYSGALSWADGNGNYQGNSYFSERSAFDPLQALKGVFDFGKGDPLVMLASTFYLDGVRGKVDGHLPLNRDTSLPAQSFNDLLFPVVAGSAANPIPGMMIDSTQIQGNQISIATWNLESNQFIQSLRYSFSLPRGCIPLPPLTSFSEQSYFALPLLCDQGDSLEYRIVAPGTF